MKSDFKKINFVIFKDLLKIRNPHLEKIDNNDVKELTSYITEKLKKEKSPDPNLELPTKKAFFELTTARNRNLINPDEQYLLKNKVAVFFGLSVGSHAALTWMMQSRADVIKIADPDTISPTNLNRLRLGWDKIGVFKTDLVHKQLLEINPYSKVYTATETNEKNMLNLINSIPKADIIIDSIDSMEGKILLRKQAQQLKIPLISAADVGDNIILDIERYDNTPQPRMFLGRVPNIEHINFSKLTTKQKRKLIIQLVGFEHNSLRMLESLMAIKGSIVTWPQLGATATIAGGLLTTTMKKIFLGERIKSGRYYISLDEILTSNHKDAKYIKNKLKKIKQINEILKSV